MYKPYNSGPDGQSLSHLNLSFEGYPLPQIEWICRRSGALGLANGAAQYADLSAQFRQPASEISVSHTSGWITHNK
jgi:hypothetical protein